MSVAASVAVRLFVLTKMTQSEIAEAAGYASASSVASLLASDTGKEAVRVETIATLAHAGAIGLRTLLDLAQHAKSEKVRREAASDLLDRAGVRTEGPVGGGPGGRQLIIQINVDRDAEERTLANVVDGEAIELAP